MPALPCRHHGGDRLHRAAHDLPAGPGYIMTPDRCFNRMTPKRPPDRTADARAATASRPPDWLPNAQFRPARITRSPDWRGEWRLTAPSLKCPVARNAPTARQQRMLVHSMPIALTAGAAS
jgi:hypothetical protein